MTRAAPVAYLAMQKRLHWLVVILLALQYFVFDGMGRPFRTAIETGIAPYDLTPVVHIGIGFAVLLLALWRIGLRLSHGAPEAPAAEPPLFAKAAKWAHAAIYALLIGLPIGGAVAWFAGLKQFGEVHEVATNILLAIVILHVAAALVHHFWWRTDVLRRMI